MDLSGMRKCKVI